MELCIKEITSIPEEFAEQAQNLYERSFQPAELRIWDEITKSLVEDAIGRTRLIMATKGKSVVGLSLFKYRAVPEFGYLWYLCVDPTIRSAGIGGKLYRETVEHLNNIARENGQALKVMMFEVERMDTEAHPEYGDPAMRMRFYDRMGALMILGYDYRQPPIPPHPEVPLQLMFHPMRLQECDCTQDEIATLVRDFLFHCQGREVTVDTSAMSLQHPRKAI